MKGPKCFVSKSYTVFGVTKISTESCDFSLSEQIQLQNPFAYHSFWFDNEADVLFVSQNKTKNGIIQRDYYSYDVSNWTNFIKLETNVPDYIKTIDHSLMINAIFEFTEYVIIFLIDNRNRGVYCVIDYKSTDKVCFKSLLTL